jgi:5-aminolevulinate synthase
MQLTNKITIIQGTLAKAFGTMGGYIASSEVIIDVVRSYSSSFIFTTALSPALAAAARSSIEYLKTSQAERAQHKKVVAQVKSALMGAAIPIKPTLTHIIPVIIGDPVLCQRISEDLLGCHKIFIQYINYPTVPRGTERLRITPTPLHTEQMIENLKDALVSTLEKFKLEEMAI